MSLLRDLHCDCAKPACGPYVGWDWLFNQEDHFINSISYCAQIRLADYAAWCNWIFTYAQTNLAAGELVKANRRMLRGALSPSDYPIIA